MIILSDPISPVTAAALDNGLTRWLVIPAFTYHSYYGGPQSDVGSCRVPLVVDVGTRLTVPISDELPADGTRYGDITSSGGGYIAAVCEGFKPRLFHLNEHPHHLGVGPLLHPGGSLSGTVAAIPDSTTAALPIIANELPYEACPSIHMSLNGKMLVEDELEFLVDITAELAWQPFTVGHRAVWLDNVTVTP